MGCDPKDIALKGFFLGPQAENSSWLKSLVDGIFEDWFAWRRAAFPWDGSAISVEDLQLREFVERAGFFQSRLNELTVRFEEEIPKFSPRYVGHMFSEISLPALLGHLVALLHNPNNICGESARVGVQIEDEALIALRRMLGFPDNKSYGHFTSGGTIANFEALVRARARMALWIASSAASDSREENIFVAAHQGWRHFSQANAKDLVDWNFVESNPWEIASRYRERFNHPFSGPVVLVPGNAHYSWKKGVSLAGIGETALWPVELDRYGKLSVPHLQSLLERAQKERKPVLMVVSVAGSTELGNIDPLHDIHRLLKEWERRGIHIWHHVDAAYGGFFCSLDLRETDALSANAKEALAAIPVANSITLDPHKLGYVPYSCGAFLCRDAEDYTAKAFGAPYIESSPNDRWLFSIEGSRPATGAAATWMTAKSIGLDSHGYGRILERTIRIKQRLERALQESNRNIQIAPHTDTNILAFTFGKPDEPISKANLNATRIHQRLSSDPLAPFWVSKTRLSLSVYGDYLRDFLSRFGAIVDSSELTVVRACIMNPFFKSVETTTDFETEFVKKVSSIVRFLEMEG